MSRISTRTWLLSAAAVGTAVVAILAFAVFGVHTLFIDEEVSEAAPVFTRVETGNDPAAATDSQVSDGGSSPGADDDDLTADRAGGDATADTAAEDIAGEPIGDRSGSFVDGAHPTSGSAVVLSDGGSQRVLRLEQDFATDNGPDLNVYLTSSADGFGDEYVDLGDLKGNIGSQNYEIPTAVDLDLYDNVVIWCVRFGVGFGSAELMP